MAVTAQSRPSVKVDPRSTHVSDRTLQPFLQLHFEAADYLNNTLPSLSVSSSTSTSTQGNQYGASASLADLASKTQTLLSQLNAQTSRLSSTLTQLTDEILRSGARLAYEVEVIKGETTGLTEALEAGLSSDMERFTSRSVTTEQSLREQNGITSGKDITRQTLVSQTLVSSDDSAGGNKTAEPEYIDRLRILTLVRSRLESVISVFGEAMQWLIAPSELSITSSLISVSAPEAGEDKGKTYAEKLRNDINDLLGNGNDAESLAAAFDRVEGLRDVAQVWKGTAEEKVRTKFVESLMRPLEEKQKSVGRNADGRDRTAAAARGAYYHDGSASDSARAGGEGGYSFLQNLQRIKNDVYLD